MYKPTELETKISENIAVRKNIMKDKESGVINMKLYQKITAIVVATILVLMALLSFRIIPTGYTGVKSTFGQVKEDPVSPGITFKIPIVQSIQKVNNKQQDILFEEKIWAETSDRTTIFFEKITITYQISSDKSSWLVANVTDYKNSILTQATVASAIKSASKELVDVDATNRGKIEPLAQEKLQNILDGKYGEDTISINRVTISNIDFEETYNDAIAAKQNAQLAYEKAAIENKQKIEKAEAEAEAKKIRADAEAEANNKINESLSDEILTNKYYEKWDGKLPSVVGNSSVMLPSDIVS
ncbi:MAG: hypothetical protein KBS82_04990 [Oscillospiraceae bacterium]|nr:hypothetical protein [Candidatus Limimonas egerieequi]